ncbi:MAG: hypothetical protein ABFC67_04740 [Mizugakiibacter sp.]|uniref:hypothetical protein n=1 Tax=Mizugakiibacter sp. TaxID=1972610 RepID=UPI00320D078A
MSLDHGILNLPIAKRGGIDTLFGVNRRQHEAQQRAAQKAAAKKLREAVREAKCLLEGVSEERLAELGAPIGLTARQCRKKLASIAHVRPHLAIRALSKEVRS